MFNMTQSDLAQAVESFALLAQNMRAEDLEQPWQWCGRDEGARSIFLRVYEVLRSTQAQAAALRRSPLSSAQVILGGLHQAYWELQAALLDCPSYLLDQSPTPAEWSIRETLRHLIRTENSFIELLQTSIEPDSPTTIHLTETREFLKQVRDQFDQQSNQTLQSNLDNILALYTEIHYRGLSSLSLLTDTQLEILCYHWEPQPFPIRYRLLRMESHLRQHTLQVEKILTAFQISHGETQQLLALIYRAIADLEVVSLGNEEIDLELGQQTTQYISDYTEALALVITQ